MARRGRGSTSLSQEEEEQEKEGKRGVQCGKGSEVKVEGIGKEKRCNERCSIQVDEKDEVV